MGVRAKGKAKSKGKSQGFFISFEGGEGTGKTTQIERLAAKFREFGKEVVCTREPGGSERADLIRSLILSHELKGIEPLTELFLYEASRAQHVKERIEPALARGAVVLCDRFADSSLVYQGQGRGLSWEIVRKLNRIATGGLSPHCTFIFDLDPKIGFSRIGSRGALDRLESEKSEFHVAVRRGYLRLLKMEPKRCFKIDAGRSVDDIHEKICAVLRKKKVLP